MFTILILMLLIGYSARYEGKVYPGVHVEGIDLSGLTVEESIELLSSKLHYPQNGKIVIQGEDKVWVASPEELGLTFDFQTTVQEAYGFGRSGNLAARILTQMGAWYFGKELSPLFVFDERVAHKYLSEIGDQIDLPMLEASLRLEGFEVVAQPGQVGRKVNIQATLEPLEGQLKSMTDGLIPLIIEESAPEILDASHQAEDLRQIVSAPLTLQMPDSLASDLGPWTIDREQLVMMLSIERVKSSEGTKYEVGIDPAALNTYLSAMAPEIALNPQNARFIFNDDTRLLEVIQPAVVGRVLDVHSTIQDINSKLAQGEHTAALNIKEIPPEIGDDKTGEELGITELVSVSSTYFRGSSEERLHNIKTAAANFHGLLISPGATFSMADTMGDVSLDNGYSEALIIFGGRTINGVGGGVCQVSTTLFRTVFLGGFPVVERHPHAYRVGYYEQTANGHNDDLAGLDATVFVPMVDFKFVNDTPYWLLMETYFNSAARRLTWKFYSTSDGRTVEWNTTGTKNVVEAPNPKYEENPELTKGEIKQVDWAADGADVTVVRTVWRNGVELFQDIFKTHYRPWQAVYQYGPGTDLPKKIKKLLKEQNGSVNSIFYLN